MHIPLRIRKPNVRIYILCLTAAQREEVSQIYKQYSWAVPIIMKYQDCTFENAFWKQLLELKQEWRSCDMVGTLSYTAHHKRKLEYIDRIICRGRWPSGYYNFFDGVNPITNDHPHMLTIVNDVCTTLRMKKPIVSYCNYWMCSPVKMEQFLAWVIGSLIPTVLAHPLAMTDAVYDGRMKPEELMKLCGVPYYPHVPFILERLTKGFFTTLKVT